MAGHRSRPWSPPTANHLAAHPVLRVVMRLLVVLGVLAIGFGLAGVVSPARAAESVCPESDAASGPSGFQLWLDAAFVATDAPPGSVLEAGFTTWDPRQRSLFPIDGLEACMRPAAGSADAVPATVRSDFPGHLIIAFVVPPGGPGAYRIGTPAEVCGEDGACSSTLVPVPVSGTGPPPDADLSVLLDATIQPLHELVAGQPADVMVEIAPRGLWDVADLVLPDQLVVLAGHRGQPPTVTVDLEALGSVGGQYTGSLTVPQGGDITLTVAIPGEDGVDRPIEDSAVLVRVTGDGPKEGARPSGEPPAAPDDTAEAGGMPPITWMAAIGVAIVGAAFLLRRRLSDL